MGIKRRAERLEATHNATGYQTPPELELYFKRLENIRREQAREPPFRSLLKKSDGSAGRTRSFAPTWSN
jgi:hypothetical protein